MTNGTLSGAASNRNYGGAGTPMVAGANSGNGMFQSLMRFDLAAALTQFDAAYGSGNWTVTAVTLRLAGNNGVAGSQPNNAIFPKIAGGAFSISWIPGDSWVEGTGSVSGSTTDGVVHDDLPLVTAGSVLLGNYNYVPPGNNVQVTWTLSLNPSFAADVAAGGSVSLWAAPGDANVSYLFNSRSFGTAANRPMLAVTAVPEPSALLLALAGGGLWLAKRRRA